MRPPQNFVEVHKVISKLLQLENNGDYDEIPNTIATLLQDKWTPKIARRLAKITNWEHGRPEKEKFVKTLTTALEKFVWSGYSDENKKEILQAEASRSCSYTKGFGDCLKVGGIFNWFYQCKDCVDDLNEVRFLCPTCFENSAHRQHNYIIINKEWGAYCCCGEVGTWKNSWTCSSHSRLPNATILPENFKKRVRSVINTILLIADRVMKDRSDDEREFVIGQQVCLVMQFANIVNFQEFYQYLNTFIELSPSQMIQCQKDVVRDGFLVITAPKLICTVIRRQLEKDDTKKIFSIIDIRSLRMRKVLNFEFSRALLNHLQEMFKYGVESRKIFTEIITNKTSSNPDSLSIKILRRCKFLIRKSVGYLECNILKLIVQGTMKEYSNKKMLAKRVLESLSDFKTDFFTNFFKMLFFTPGLFANLIIEEDALRIWVKRLKVNVAGARYEEHEFDVSDVSTANNKPVLKALQKLMSLLPKSWTKELSNGVLNGFTDFLEVLTSYEYYDSELRQGETDEHVEFEDDYSEVYDVQDKLFRICSLFLECCSEDDELLERVWEITIKVFQSKFCKRELESRTKLLDHVGNYTEYNSICHPVSICLPFSRFVMSLYLMKIEKKHPVTLDVSTVFERILRIQVMRAEVDAGLWIRNGATPRHRLNFYIDQSSNYHWDLRLMQIVASTTESNQFMIRMLGKYKLLQWITPIAHDRKELNDKEGVQTVVTMAENFLRQLIFILTERSIPQVGCDVTDRDGIKLKMIHLLCEEPLPSYELIPIVHKMRNKTPYRDLFEEIAVLNSNGLYEPRPEVMHIFHPLHYLYTNSKMLQAKENQLLNLKKVGKPQFFPPSGIPQLKTFFVPIVNIFQCDITLHMIKTILEQSTNPESGYFSEDLLEYALYLIGYALLEQASGRYPMLRFTQRASEWHLLEQLEKLLAKLTEDANNKELLKWTVVKFKGMTEMHTMTYESVLTEEDQAKKDRKERLAKHREAIMKQIKKDQSKFIDTCQQIKKDVILVDGGINSDDKEETEKICILCHNVKETESDGGNNDASMMMRVGLIQPSDVLSFDRKDFSLTPDSLVLPFDIGHSYYINSCGHPMHFKCFDSYRIGMYSQRQLCLDGERPFKCPLCNFIGNAKLPVLSREGKYRKNEQPQVQELQTTFRSFTIRNIYSTNPFHIWKSIAYTIHVEETLLRSSKRPLLGRLTYGQQNSLESLTLIAKYFPVAYQISEDDFHAFQKLVNDLIRKPVREFRDIDMFSLALAMLFSGIDIFDTTESQTLHTLCAVQMQLTLSVSCLIKSAMNNKYVLWQNRRDSCIIFLRCCVLLRSLLRNPPSSEELSKPGGDTFENMCQYLGLPQTREAFLSGRPISRNSIKIYDPLHINQLIPLPEDYTELIRLGRSIECSVCGKEDIQYPGICLVCGETFCVSQNCSILENGTFKCQAVRHTKKCGNLFFLSIAQFTVNFGMKTNHSFLTQLVPYDDKYNNPLVATSNKFPLILSKEKYKKLNDMWLNHNTIQEAYKLYSIENLNN